MVSTILSTKLCIIQFYSKVLAFVKSDLTCHPQVVISSRKIEGCGEGGGGGGGKNTCISENFCPFYMKFCTVLTIWNKS